MNTATPLSNAAAAEELGRHHAMSGTAPNHLAAAMPYNTNKPLEHGLVKSLHPPFRAGTP